MTEKTKNIIEQILLLKEEDKIEVMNFMVTVCMSNKFSVLQLDDRVLFILDSKALTFNPINKKKSQRDALQKSLTKISKYKTFQTVTDPVLWQKQQRDDR